MVDDGRKKKEPSPKELFGHLAAVPAFTFLECAAYAWEMPGIFLRLKAEGHVLWPQDPGVVGQAATWVGPLVVVHQFSGRGHSIVQIIFPKSEFGRMLDEVE